MTNVYDIIIRIRDEKKLTTRHLALMAGIPPTTLESALQRKPERISMRMLVGIARVFGMPWYALLTSSDDPESLSLGKNPNRIPCDQIPDDEAERIVQIFLTAQMIESAAKPVSAVRFSGWPSHAISGDEHFRQSILVVLHKLNGDGLMEVMRHALEVANNPLYTRKEEPTCSNEDT